MNILRLIEKLEGLLKKFKPYLLPAIAAAASTCNLICSFLPDDYPALRLIATILFYIELFLTPAKKHLN